MNDLVLLAGASAVAVGGLGGAIALSRLGVPRTYVRDLVHVGTGVWVLGWPWWRAPVAPIAITAAALLLVVLGPRALRMALSGGEERWGGVVTYVAMYGAFTAIALLDRPFPAGGALLALALGDGVGGAVGRRFGRTFYAAPGGKQKSVEGSIAVLAMSAAGVLVASARFGAHAGPLVVITAAVVAAIAEALAPRGTDNAVVPVATWVALRALT